MPVESIIYVLSGIVIAVVFGTIGKIVGSNGKVKETTCIERQHFISVVLGIK